MNNETPPEIKAQPEPAAPVAVSAEPALFTVDWFDAVIAANEQMAAQKLAEYQQLCGAIAMLTQQRALLDAKE